MVVGAVLTMGDAVGSEVVEHALEHILHQPLFVSLQMSVTRPYGILCHGVVCGDRSRQLSG